MAKKDSRVDETTFNINISLSGKQIEAICEGVDAPGLSVGEKIAGFCLSACKEVAAGGMLVDANDMQHLRESTGLEVESIDDILPKLEEISGMSEGMHRFVVKIDPEYYLAIDEIAKVRGWDVQQLVQEAVDNAQFQGWFDAVPDTKLFWVIMSHEDKDELEELVGKFETGRDLLKRIQSKIGQPVLSDDRDGVFDILETA